MMRKAFAVTVRILQQFRHDPRTVVMFIFAPILVLWLFSVMLNSPAYHPIIAGVNLPSDLITAIEAQDATYVAMNEDEADQLLSSGEIDAVCTLDRSRLSVRVEGANPSKTGAVMNVVRAAVKEYTLIEREQLQADIESRLAEARSQMEDLTESLGSVPVTMLPEIPDLDTIVTEFAPTIADIEVNYLHGSDAWGTFDFFGPVFIGIFIFMFVFITSGMSLVTERLGGTMERLLATPIRPWQLVLGFSLGFAVISLIQAVIVLWACITLIGFPNEGPLWLVVVVTFSMALVSLNLGLLASALARTPFQVIQLLLLLVMPQILLSGIFDLSAAPLWMQVLSQCFPITHGAEALRSIMLRGAEFGEVAPNLGILWGFVLAFFGLASVSFARRKSH